MLLNAGKADQARAQLGAANQTFRLAPQDASTRSVKCQMVGMERDLFVELTADDRSYLVSCTPPAVERGLYELPISVHAHSLVSSGKFSEALESAKAEKASQPVQSFFAGLVRSSEQCTTDPFRATTALSEGLTALNPNAGQTYQRATSELIAGEDITLAARDLARLEARLDPPIGRIIDRVSRCAEAGGLEVRAYEHARLRMLDLALREVILAKQVSAEMVEHSGLLPLIGHARERELLERSANLQAAGDPELSYAYGLAAAALQGFPKSSMTLLAANEAVVRRRLRRTVALRAVGSVSPAFASAFESVVREHLPSYLHLNPSVGGDRAADAEVIYSTVGPRRQFKGHVETQYKKVVAYEALVPNPAYEEAQSAYNDAVDSLTSAREQYEILHQGANNLANQASAGAGISAALSAIAALGSGAEEVTGATLLHDAQEKLAETRQHLQSTRRTKRETRMADSTYPTIVLTETATSYFTYRLAVRGVQPVERTVPFSLEATSRRTPPAPRIDVTGSTDAVDLGRLAPDLMSSVSDLGGKVVALLRALEENRIWNAATTAARSGDIDGAALQYVAFLHTASIDAGRNKEALQYLVRNLR